jgi:hypothetical protein
VRRMRLHKEIERDRGGAVMSKNKGCEIERI